MRSCCPTDWASREWVTRCDWFVVFDKKIEAGWGCILVKESSFQAPGTVLAIAETQQPAELKGVTIQEVFTNFGFLHGFNIISCHMRLPCFDIICL